MAEEDVEARLEKQVAKGLEEIRNERVINAENHIAYMRNWLAILTFTITVAFLIAGLIGYRSGTATDDWPEFPVLAEICSKCGRMDLHVATPGQFKQWLDSQNAKARAGGAGD